MGKYIYIYTGWRYTYPSEKYESQMGFFFPIYGKKCSKPPTSLRYMYIPLELFLHFPKSWSSSLWKIAISGYIPFPDASTLGWKINDSFTSAIDLIDTRLCCLMACRKNANNKQTTAMSLVRESPFHQHEELSIVSSIWQQATWS